MDSPVREDFAADILLKHPHTRDGMTHLLIPRGKPRGYSFSERTVKRRRVTGTRLDRARMALVTLNKNLVLPVRSFTFDPVSETV